MADNYLGRKMEEYQNRPATHPQPHATISRLLLKNRSHRGYDPNFIVREDQLRRIIAVNTRIPSARNQQVLRFRPVLSDEAAKVLPHIRLGAALPELHLPLPGTEPNAFIVICSTVEEGPFVDIDLGISAQSMLLQAVEIGLNGICIGAFNRRKIMEELQLEYTPLMILAIGKGIEKIELVEIGEDESHAYYRENGTHYVPKVRLEDLIL
ncbi:MAG TPA: nitroreductase family protein [Candidatus Alistipes avicola]|uniref:Nitroreductase family protein n=1 Tax=Candidatus Alistipes avicola TaxID=2838432 RepID=A0A9D2IED7_9BACT|nr:nitroreductase family protein [uncultured Alistipes sp.]HJA98582.1 nitroreductase family protein [Candidatus Alistipes avicola]